MRNTNLAQTWMVLVGLVLLAAGLIGFLNTPLAGTSTNALLATDTVHNVVHVLTGLLALGIAFGLRGDQQVSAVIGFGVLYVIIFVAVLLSPNLFGLFTVSANAPIHVIHAAVAIVTLAVGLMARGSSTQTAS
jgi:methylglyoxal synthase